MSSDESLELLLVEDSPGDARFIRELLKDAAELSVRSSAATGDGDRTDVAGRGTTPTLHHAERLAEGLDILREISVDVVLLDLDLPDSNGLDTLEAVDDATDTPVVVLTGLRDREVGVQALREGAEEYLVKDEINSDLLIRSVYHAIERREHQRDLKRYEVLMEQSTDVNAVLDLDGTIRYVTPSVERVLGYEPDDVVGVEAFEFVHPEDRDEATAIFDRIVDGEDRPPLEFRFERADGSYAILEARSRNLRDDPLIDGIAVYTRDVTQRAERERQLERQREHLAALDALNGVVRDITAALVDQSTREDVEQVVVGGLADSDSYLFAWIGEVDQRQGEVAVTAQAGADAYLDDVTVLIDEDDPRGRGPTARAIRTGEMQVVDDVRTDEDFEPWRDRAEAMGVRSSAAIPLTYRQTLYGVLNVYADRPAAFEGEEGAVVGQLGGIVAHAINAIERKQVLLGDEVVELEFTVQDYFEAIDVGDAPEGTITFGRTIPVDEDRFVVYGSASETGLDTLETLRERVPHWTDLSVEGDDGEGYRFDLRLSRPPVFSLVAELGGRVHRATIEDGTYHLTVHVPPSADVRRVTDAVRDAHPGAQLIAQRHTVAAGDSLPLLTQALDDRLTDRQRSVLEAAYFAGFFEWPRDHTGEDVAEALDISPPTFHQHLRTAERELLGVVFADVDRDG